MTSSNSQQFWRDPAMPFVESRRACHSKACYKPHSHATYSIGAVDEGNSVFTGAGDGPVRLRAGSLVFVPASRVHACNPVSGAAWSYQMLHLDATWLRAVRQEYARAGQPRSDSEPIRIVNEPAAYARFCRLNALLFSPADPLDKEAALIEFIGDCDTARGMTIEAPRVAPRLAGQLKPALDYLHGSPAAHTRLDELARLAGMSRYGLIRAFRAATGMTPHAWQLNQRINIAREQIQAGRDIADVAYCLGFADQAHLQRVFKAHVGVTPGRFRT
jgi:AraC-like DNA-binding protein